MRKELLLASVLMWKARYVFPLAPGSVLAQVAAKTAEILLTYEDSAPTWKQHVVVSELLDFLAPGRAPEVVVYDMLDVDVKDDVDIYDLLVEELETWSVEALESEAEVRRY
jgi:hypothetical protein